jgi:hypothetical protein
MGNFFFVFQVFVNFNSITSWYVVANPMLCLIPSCIQLFCCFGIVCEQSLVMDGVICRLCLMSDFCSLLDQYHCPFNADGY